MNYTEAKAALRGRFKIAFAGAKPVAWPNKAFDPATEAASGWYVRFSTTTAGADQVASGSPGSNPTRQYGQLTLAIYAPENEGEADADTLGDTIIDIFRGYSTGHLRCRPVPFARQIGNENGYYRLNVIVPFEFDDHF